ncbi:MAG: amino acid ABC transporter substrate-binding protein, partial [Alphaproteobacteria bacterium]|nr:amino acid ABC transporter substrate-binding protein [Alphaproteobacteria bacterium]
PPPPPAKQFAKQSSAFDRIVRTKTIRCGYITYPPYLIKDPNTGEFSGVAFDFMTAIAKELDTKLEWVEEVGWGTFQEGLKGNRYDVMCVPVWQSGQRAQVALLTKPLYYNGLYAAARADDNRFDKGIDSINQPDVRVAVVDGDVTQAVRKQLFPKSQEVATTQLSDKAQEVLSVATKKADIVFVNLDQLNRYNKSATDKLQLVLTAKPVRLFANSLAVNLGEHDLKAALDATIEAVTNSGQTSQILSQYSTILGSNTTMP